ncbi:hypothetical protein HCN44_008267 [Aphidius gifuensis]|uniref:Cuticular protein n=2 Tax=Aphidius gifuensis TaxID=684658 RepID=A0A834XLU3_APHGI|nr:hypothetical protein HCN44_008267 [Aphidius gifuensis]
MSIASLEPSGYRPPGSHQISSDLYLPPTDSYSGSSSRGVQTPEFHYLPSMSHQSTSQNVIPNSLYLPSNHEQTHTQQHTLSEVLSSDQSVSKPMNQYLPPSNQYLPAITKPTNQYLPSSSSSLPMNTNKRQRQNTYRQQSSSDISHSSTNRFSNNNNNHMTNINNLPSQYLPPNKRPNAFTQAIPSSNYLPANQNNAYQPSDEILPPSNTYLTQNKYESTENQQHDHSSSYKPSQSSGYPSSGGYPQAKNNNNNNNNNNGYNYEPPAKYEFEYMVNDPESGNDFGHKESRDGDVTRGTYYVLLPDGRKQTVNFIADANGYRPTITYEDAAVGRDGYDQGYHY